MKSLLLFFMTMVMGGTAMSQVSGTVFKDFNFNGTQQSASFPVEPGVYGVQVKAYNAAGLQLGTTKSTNSVGDYSFSNVEIPSGTVIRLEFVTPSGSMDSKSAAAGSKSSVQFLTAPSTTSDYGISSPFWFSKSANPYVATNSASNGNPTGGGTSGTNENLFIFPYNMGNGTPDDGGATRRLPNSQLGSVFGLSYQKITRTLLISAYLKRHVGFGSGGIGAIYKSTVSATGVPGNATLLVDVNAIGINVGTDPRTVALPVSSTAQNSDPNTFSQVGKRGIGGISLDESGSNLYLVNMFQNKLHRINVGLPAKTTFSAADVTGSWTIPATLNPGTVFHPMACKFSDGKVYIGGVVVREKTTAHNLATDTVGSRGVVIEFNPTTNTFTEVLNFGFNYRRGFANGDLRFPNKANWWCAWQNNGNGGATDPMQADYNTAAGAFNGGVYYPQPMISDLDFDVTGELIVGVRDRFGDQMGYQNISTDGLPTGTGFGGANNYFRALTSGEVLRAGKNVLGNSFTLESQGSVTNNGVTNASLGLAASNPAVGGSWTAGTGTPWGGFYGPGWGGTAATIPAGGPNPGTQGGYYYYNHNFTIAGTPATLNGTANAIGSHYLKSNGGLAVLAGSGEVVHTLMDPVNTSYEQGVSRMVNNGANAGNMNQRLTLTTTLPGDPTNMGKAGGMCDIELLIDYQPIEVGNRVWADANNNGIQDAGEPGINNQTLQLMSPGPDGIFGTGDDIVLATTISSATGEFNFSTLTVADARKPITFTGVGANDIVPGLQYQIRMALPTGYQVADTDAGSNNFDNIDNDGVFSGNYVRVNFSTFGSDHSIDIGLSTFATLGNRVWRDDGSGGGVANDGIQNGTEPGVAGVPVNLYVNGVDGLPSTADDILTATTITDAFGIYQFDNLTPTTQTNATTIAKTSYSVRINAPSNYSFTTQTNTTDDNNTTGTSVTGSDVNYQGESYSINLSAGEINLNVDAGLVFKNVAATSSIGDFVWLDTNGNGVQNAGEPGVSGVVVTLYDAATGNILAVTTTDAGGNYIFTNLPNGTYQVGFSAPGGTVLSPSTGTTPGNATTNSDPDVTTGKTTTITISAASTIITGIDAGLTTDVKGALGDFVWNDLNANGIQDAGEPGIAGVTMKLYDAGTNGIIGGGDDVLKSTTTTDAKGYYIFSKLDPAKYFVVASTVTGFTVSSLFATNPAGFVKDNNFIVGSGTYAGTYTSNVGTLFPIAGGITRDMTIDLGLYSSTANLNSLGDRVWFDINANGVQDSGEPGFANITVRLLNAVGAAVNNPATGKPYVTSSDANGAYKFVNLADGNYIVEFANLPTGYSFTKSDATGSGAPGSVPDGADDSDPNTITGRTGIVDLDAAGSISTSVNNIKVDAGVTQGVAAGTASLGDRVWYDANGNGIQDAAEYGVANVKVELLDAANAAVDGDPSTAGIQPYITYTNGLGEYRFTGLSAGIYKVRFSSLPLGYTASAINVGSDREKDADATFAGTSTAATTALTPITYTLSQGEDNLTVDMGIIAAAGLNTIGDFVWNDKDKDGLQDVNEPGVPGVTVTIYTNGADGFAGTTDDVFIRTTTTDVNGGYIFNGLADGNYNVGFSNLPAGFNFTSKDAPGFTAANGSDASPAGGRTATVAVDPTSVNPASVVNKDVDAGIFSTRAVLGDYVWFDANSDGVQDPTEKGISGVTVTLYGSDGTTVLASTVTDAKGAYNFSNLNAGSYVVGFSTVPDNLGFTKQNTPGDNGNNANSDANPATGKTGIIILSAGETDLTIDAGLMPDNPAAVGDFVWYDVNGNGVQNANEPGVPGVLVTLYDAANNIVGSAITDGNGAYLITNIPAGSGYYIIFSNKPGTSVFTTRTSDVSAGDATLGSDPDETTGKTATFSLVAGTKLLSLDAGLKNVLVLPLSIQFTAVKNNTAVNLDWTLTGDITSVREYVIERSANGTTFSPLANTIADGRSRYQKTDAQPSTGINYYRIKLVSFDGNISYSETRIVIFDGKNVITVFPNPASEILFVKLSEQYQGKNISLALINAAGQTTLSFSTKNAAQVEKLQVNNLAAGTYFLRILQDGKMIETVNVKLGK